jgi:hypothetical protein
MQKGFARPGYFFIDGKGIIREKFFDARYRERLTGNSLLAKLFPELGQEVTETVEAPHLQLARTSTASVIRVQRTPVASDRSRVCRRMCISTRPTRKGISQSSCRWTRFRNCSCSGWFIHHRKRSICGRSRNQYPFWGSVHISQDIQVATGAEFWGSPGKDGKTFTITGKLEYQACDKITCYVPTSVPVKWPPAAVSSGPHACPRGHSAQIRNSACYSICLLPC